jgi:hypothetical protein
MASTRASTRLNVIETLVVHIAKTKYTQDDVLLDATEDQPDAGGAFHDSGKHV